MQPVLVTRAPTQPLVRENPDSLHLQLDFIPLFQKTPHFGAGAGSRLRLAGRLRAQEAFLISVTVRPGGEKCMGMDPVGESAELWMIRGRVSRQQEIERRFVK